MPSSQPSRPPAGLVAGLGRAAREFVRETWRQYELSDAESRLLRLAADALDRAASAREAISRDGALLTSPRGRQYVHPAVRVEHQSATRFAALCRVLRLDQEDR